MGAADLPSTPHPTARLVGTAPAMEALRAQIRHLATFDTVGSALVPTLLLQGETGTGKGLVARVVHDSGPRVAGPFLEVNCAAIPETMLEAELFGFEPGAFTDAKRAKPGLFEAAAGGSLFLDEIDALPLALQGKLLTAIEAKRVRRLGAVTERAVDVKLIAATNAALPEYVAAGRFRADLYHRLAVVVLLLPPLRERDDDVLVLAQAFLQQYAGALGVQPKHLNADATAWLRGYAWPGNVRELSHVMERVTLLHTEAEVDGTTLEQLCLPLEPSVPQAVPRSQGRDAVPALPEEAEQLRQVLAQTGGNVVQAARLLGISRGTIRYRMQRYGIGQLRHEEMPLSEEVEPTGILLPPSSLPSRERARTSPSVGEDVDQGPVTGAGDSLTPALSRGEREKKSGEAVEQRDTGRTGVKAEELRAPAPTWEQKPVAVLALELTWPEVQEAELPRYEPWTEAARWERLIVEKVRGFGGVLLQHTAALLTCAFGLPRTLEHLPQRAVQTALALRQMVTTGEASPGAAPRPDVRLAVHVGKVLVDAQALDPAARLLAVGETLALPVRLLGQAEPGEIVVSPEVERLVEGWVTLEARVVRRRAGAPEQIEGYAVTGASLTRAALAPHSSRVLGQFVGRERELAILDTALQQVERGQGQVVGLMGDAGVGKSRLLYEFRQRVAGQEVTYVEGRCLSYGSAMPYLPVLDLLRALCGITPAASPETASVHMRRSLQRLGLMADEGLPYLLQLLGVSAGTEALARLTPEAIKTRTFAILHQLCLSSSQQRPLVLEIEDLHWIDTASEAYLAALAEALPGAPILLLVTYRPGYRPPWMEKSHATQLTLGPLSAPDSLTVVHAAQQRTPLSSALAQMILDKAEGNPFFLEELTKAVLEHRTLPAAVTVPTTIQGVLMARIDRLPEAPRRLLQTAAILGRAFAPRLLEAIWDGPDDLTGLLQGLQRLEFLYERREPQESLYIFKHALIQEVAYESLGVTRRQALHAAAGHALETLYAMRLEEVYERLAYHYARTTDSPKAVEYLMHVARKAARVYALVEAVSALQEARRHVAQLPDARRNHRAFDLVLRQARLLTFLGRLPQALELLLGVQGDLEHLQEPALEGPYYALLGTTYSLMGDRTRAIQHAQRALAPATQCTDHATLGRTYYVLSMEDMWSGQWQQGVAHGQQAITCLEQARDQGWLGQAYWITGANYMFLGQFPQALTAEAQVQVIGDSIGSPRLQSYAAWTTGLTRTLMGAWEDGIAQCQRAVEQAPDPFCSTEAEGFLGYAYLEKGDAAAALPVLEQAAQRMQRFRFRQLEGWFTIWWGEACLLDGQHARAQELVLQGLEVARDVAFQVVVGWGQRALGQIALGSGTHRAAAVHLQAALSTFTALQSSLEVARTLLALAALAHAQGHIDAVAAHVRQAYALFQTLQVPVYIGRTRQLATAFEIALGAEST